MKTSAKKSTTASPTATQAAQTPFFAARGGGGFFAPARQVAPPAVQMKLTVNEPGDAFEQEAERMAGRVMRMPDAQLAAKEGKAQRESAIQRVAAPEEKLRKNEPEKREPSSEWAKVQRKETGGAPEIPPHLASAIREQASGGEPLPSEARSYLEPRLGADFSGVRIHTGQQAAAAASQLSARAFTYQNHLFFAKDQFQPGTDSGKQLLAHELTHTLQQGRGVRRQGGGLAPLKKVPVPLEETVRRAPAKAKAAAEAVTSSEVVDLSSGAFTPSQKVRDEIEAQGHKGLAVRVVVKGVTGEGQLKVRADRAKNYDSLARGSMPLLAPWAQQIGGLYINFKLVNSEIKGGYASPKPGGGDTNDWLQSVQKNAAVLGGLGLKVGHLPTPVNKFEGGKLTLGVTGMKVEIAGFLDALFSLSVENAEKPKVEASADINVKGIAKGQLKADNSKDALAGQVSLAVEFKSFSGMALIKYNPDGTVDIGGKAGYNADRLSGQIEFVSTDIDTANAFAKDAIAAAGGKEKVQEAPPPAPVPPPKPGKKQRGIAATGMLAFNLTNWFAGAVHVVVDGKGALTVIGKIAPPGEILLFRQRDWDKELIKFEAKAYYGIPVVGNLNLFANISLHAIASLGPAKIYNIEILGTYSTDPEIQKFIQISGSFNISAYAGLRLRAEGGAGVEILDHDLKFGIGLQADVGVKAYVDARPTVGYRDPGEFYVSGTLEMVAQPMLGLSGDFFIALETPWWSPLSDDRWTWPLFSKEWPLTDPIGINAVVKDYVLGSGKVPEIELKKPEFDPSKFMSKMVDNELPNKSGGAGAGQGSFKEDGTVQKPAIPPKKPEPKKADAKLPKKGTPPKAGKSAAPDPKAAKDQAGTKLLQGAAQPLAALKGKGPLTRAELNQELARIKAKVGAVDFDVQVRGEKWAVTPKAGGHAGKAVELAAKDAAKDAGKPDGRTDAQMKHDLEAAIKDATALVDDETKDKADIEKALPDIKTHFKLTAIILIEVAEGEDVIVDAVKATINPALTTHQKKKKRPNVKTGDRVQTMYNGDWSADFIKVTKQINQYKWEASGKIDKTQVAKTLFARDYGKDWRKYNPYKTGEAWEAIKGLDVWTSSKDASQVLSYRKHARFDVPPGKNWHHIHEQGNNGPHSLPNLALVEAALNQGFLNAYFTKAYPETGGLPLRQWLKGKSHDVHMEWGLKAIAAAGKVVTWNKDEGRGRYNEIG